MANRKNPSLTLILALLCVAAVAGCHDHSSPEYNVSEAVGPSDTLTFAGSQTCRTCHQAIYESWEKTRHTKKVRAANLTTVVNDADNNGTNDFVQGGTGIAFQVAFDGYNLSAGVEFPSLGWDGTNLLIRIGPNTYPVTYLLGGTGKWKQRYMITIGNAEYVSPVQYNEVTRQYVPYHPEHWYVVPTGTKNLTAYMYGSATQTPVTQGNTDKSWQKNCVGCHTTGLRDISVSQDGEYGDNISDLLANTSGPRLSELPVGCEACHGPSARHVELGGGVGTANNPDDLAADRGDEVCGSCHGRGKSTHPDKLGYPWASGSLVDNGFRPGDVLADFYVNGGGHWGDGAAHSQKHHQQWLDHKDSPHAKAGVTCWKCHAPHGSNIEGDLRMEPQELCLSCHDGQGDIDSGNLALHTRHTAVEAQSCANCHFTFTAKSAIEYDVNSHTYRIIYPTETDDSGIPNSCAACHDDESTSELTSYLRTRFPDVKPVAYASSQPSPFGVGFDLDGKRSFDPLGGTLTYEWIFKSGPPSFTADQLLAKTGGDALFVPSQPGKHVFMLVVTNEDGVRSNATEVEVDVTSGIDQNAPDLTQANYVRSFACSFCHEDTHADWEVTRHTQKVRRPNEGHGVVFADSDNNTLNDWEGPFNLAIDPVPGQTAWDTADQAYGSGITAPIINYNSSTDTYTVTIGLNTYEVTWLLGGTGKWKQRYMVTLGEGEYILPIQYNEVTKEWVQYHPENWYIINNGSFDGYLYGFGETPAGVDPVRTADSWQRRCTACHVTGARDMTQDPGTLEWGKSIETMLTASTGPRIADTGTGCEACHGPGSIHANAPTLRGSIVNPDKLSAQRSNEVCGACHNRGKGLHADGFSFPWGTSAVDGHFIPGMDLSDFFKPNDELSGSFWGDPYGHSKQHHQQWLDMRWSDHFQKGGMTCNTCHTGHNDRIAGQLKQEETSLCKSCHPGIVTGQGRAANHSRHPDGVTSCSNCHNPLVAKSAINPDISAHSFQIIWPAASLWPNVSTAGIFNSCNTRGCHSSSIQGLRAWDYSSQLDAEDDYAEHQLRLNQLWGDMRPYAEPRVVDHPGDGKSRRVVTGITAAPTVIVTLDGTKSYDPNGKSIIAYQWSILSAPGGSSAKLGNRLAAKPTIEITVPGTYVFTLVVQDPDATSEPETVTVVVN